MIVFESDTHVIFDAETVKQNYQAVSSLIEQADVTDTFVFIILTGGDALSSSYYINIDEILLRYQRQAISLNKRFVILLSSILEAQTYRYNLKRTIDNISNVTQIPTSKIIILNGAQTQFDDPVKQATSFMMFGTKHIFERSTETNLPSCHFLSLSRIAKMHRTLATVQMLDRGLDKYGLISLGSGYYHDPNINDIGFSAVPERYKDRLPLTVDGIISPGPTNLNQYKANDQFLNAFINVVLETSFDRNIIKNAGWNTVFLTEKSAKPFAWGQVPIFISCKGIVQVIRDLGFDLFDDIIDHQYDNELEPIKRITLAIDQLEKICNIPIDTWIKYKSTHMNRFVLNRQLMMKYHERLNVHYTVNNLKKALSD